MSMMAAVVVVVVGEHPSRGLSDHLWRAALTLLLSAVAMHVAWSLVRPLLGPLAVVVVLVGVVRLAAGWWHRNGGW
jgi:type IV secretory pathway VirB2 component (pilin)